jgi:Flp pilus assembly protein TadG
MAEQTRPWKRILTDTGGQEIAEAAVVLPIVFLLLIGIMTFARAYNIYTTITYAAQEGARLAAQSSSASSTDTPSTTPEVANRVVAVLQASSIDPGQIQAFSGPSTSCSGGAPPCTSSNNVTVCTNVAINATGGGTVTGPAACGVTVSFKYPYTFLLPFVSVNGKTIHMIADVEVPEEN